MSDLTSETMSVSTATVKGKFITLEGGEGSGKTTQAALLADYLISQGHKVVLTKEPGGTPGALEIRQLLLSGEDQRWLPKTELLLMVAARVEHWGKVIKPALNDGCWVICDRFVDSTYAYQGKGRGIDSNLIRTLHLTMLPNAVPDLTILLDVDIEKGLKRAISREEAKNGSETRFEQVGIEFHQRVHKGFRKLAQCNSQRIRTIHTNDLTVEQVHDAVVTVVKTTIS